MRRATPLASLVLGIVILSTAAPAGQARPGTLGLGAAAFESYLELLRQQAGIPGLSAALVQDGEVVWARGLGFANQETRVRATPDTPYLAADLSQTFASVLLLQCVEQRRLQLDAPLRAYGVALPESGATLRQVLSHTSTAGGTPFTYDPERFAQLTRAMEYCAPQPYRKSIAHRLLERLALIDSVPGRDLTDSSTAPEGQFEPAVLERYRRVLEGLATPYRVDKRGRATRTELPPDGINATTGLVTTVRDLARFDKALTDGVLLREETLAAAWTPAVAVDGTVVPTGLGWFVQSYRGVPVVWHFGVIPSGYSALVVKVPTHGATMILLANSDGLFVPLQLETGDVTRSVFASVFLRMLL